MEIQLFRKHLFKLVSSAWAPLAVVQCKAAFRQRLSIRTNILVETLIFTLRLRWINLLHSYLNLMFVVISVLICNLFMLILCAVSLLETHFQASSGFLIGSYIHTFTSHWHQTCDECAHFLTQPKLLPRKTVINQLSTNENKIPKGLLLFLRSVIIRIC